LRLYWWKETGNQNELLPESEQRMNTKEMIMKRSTIGKTFAIVAVAAVALGIAPPAKAADKGCSNATLRGTFVHTASGFVTPPASMAVPLAGVGTDTFDGNGGATGTATINLNGTPLPPQKLTGTYTVNPDCTGKYTISGPRGTTILSLVIGDNGNEIQAICVDSGVVLTHIFRRQFPVGDWRE
jgi:hypothetical protein